MCVIVDWCKVAFRHGIKKEAKSQLRSNTGSRHVRRASQDLGWNKGGEMATFFRGFPFCLSLSLSLFIKVHAVGRGGEKAGRGERFHP